MVKKKKVNWICQSEFIKANYYRILMSHIHKVTFALHDHILSFHLTMLSKKEKKITYKCEVTGYLIYGG